MYISQGFSLHLQVGLLTARICFKHLSSQFRIICLAIITHSADLLQTLVQPVSYRLLGPHYSPCGFSTDTCPASFVSSALAPLLTMRILFRHLSSQFRIVCLATSSSMVYSSSSRASSSSNCRLLRMSTERYVSMLERKGTKVTSACWKGNGNKAKSAC